MKNEIFLVRCSYGSYDDYLEKVIFVTENKSKAVKYVRKYNAILKKWKEYYSQYEEPLYTYKWIKKEFVNQYFDRWNKLQRLNKCSFEKIEVR